MALYLSSDDLGRLRAVQNAMLSPLAAPSAEAWGQGVIAGLCDLFGTESAFLMLPTDGHPIVSQGVDRLLFEGIDHFIVSPNRNGERSPDPVVPVVVRKMTRRGVRVADYAFLDDLLDGTFRASRFYNEVERVCGISDFQGMYLPAPGDPGVRVQVHTYQTGGRTNPFGRAGIEVSQLLVPAFQAGVQTLLRLGGQRAALDALSQPTAVYDLAGRVLHQNASLERHLAHDPSQEQVAAAAARLARDLGARHEDDLADRPERTVTTARGAYRLRGTLLPYGGPFGEVPSVLVAVEPPAAPWPDATTLRSRFGLTRREVDVALGLAEGHANVAIADALCISPHTARRHTERVMAKLGVASRAQVAAALLSGD